MLTFLGHLVYNSIGNNVCVFEHGGHEPEVVISRSLLHLKGPYQDLFYSFRTW